VAKLVFVELYFAGGLAAAGGLPPPPVPAGKPSPPTGYLVLDVFLKLRLERHHFEPDQQGCVAVPELLVRDYSRNRTGPWHPGYRIR